MTRPQPSYLLLLFGLAMLLTDATDLFARVLADLYSAQAIVTGTGEANRQPGLIQCLERVLVRVSGDQRVLLKSELGSLRAKAGTLVSGFRYRDRMEGIPIHDEQGTHDRPHDLTCLYEPSTIDATLASLGSRPWLTDRPRLAVFLAVEDQRREFVLASDGQESPYMVQSIQAAAHPMAIEIAIPDAAARERLGLSYEEVRVASPELMGGFAKSVGGDVALLGTLRWSENDLGWVARWRLVFGEDVHEWGVRGVSFDDAFRDAIKGAAQILSGNGVP